MTKSLVMGWAFLYTTPLPRRIRTARRWEIRADLHDQMTQERDEGISPTRTSMHVVSRVVCGAWDDVSWALPQLPATMIGHLTSASNALGHVGPSPWAISSLAVLGLMSWALAMSDRHHPWFQWLLVNAGVLAIALLLQRGKTSSVRRVFLLWGAFSFVLAVVTAASASPGSLLPQVHVDYKLVLEAVLMPALVILGLLVAVRVCGISVLDGNPWWSVLLCVPVIASVLWGYGIAVDGSAESLQEVSVATAVLFVGWVALAADLCLWF